MLLNLPATNLTLCLQPTMLNAYPQPPTAADANSLNYLTYLDGAVAHGAYTRVESLLCSITRIPSHRCSPVGIELLLLPDIQPSRNL